ncbi:hypothetical protein OE88DRAFT_1653601 [Heliocybe sulcata]|nr:hypothetical protein OE88DRAFT_1654611 [Heliocybe sulcata]TFK54997.1 hypothetical protein OE88DRAFT_1653601 [Heliocybe sulcata]
MTIADKTSARLVELTTSESLTVSLPSADHRLAMSTSLTKLWSTPQATTSRGRIC